MKTLNLWATLATAVSLLSTNSTTHGKQWRARRYAGGYSTHRQRARLLRQETRRRTDNTDRYKTAAYFAKRRQALRTKGGDR